MIIQEVEAIADEIKELTPVAKLRLAADLLELQKPRLAHAVADQVVCELGAVIALEDLSRPR